MELADVGHELLRHNTLMREYATEWGWFEAAYESKFWTCNPYHSTEDLATSMWDEKAADPVKVSTNHIYPFLAAQVGNLYLRAPRTRIEPPATTPKPGRPSKMFAEAPRHLEAVCDQWLNSVSIQAEATYAYQLALVHGASAFKLYTCDDRSSPLARIRLTTIPRWECMWDERAKPEQELYRGHLRWETLERAQQIVGDPLELAEPVPLADMLEAISGTQPSSSSQSRGRYVQILELYDIADEGSQQFYLVRSRGYTSVDIVPVGKKLPAPFTGPNSEPRVPMAPVILANGLNKPLKGIPAVRRVYSQQAEDSLLMTGVANGMRRDMDRFVAYQAGRLNPKFFEALREGGDQRWIAVEGGLEGAWKPIDVPSFAPSLPMYKEWIDDSRQRAQAMSDIQTGRQGKYLTAQEATLLADAGEATTTEIGSRMVSALSATVGLFLCGLDAEMSGELEVYRSGDAFRITREMVRVPWTVRVVDAASTPVRDAQRKADLLQYMTPYLTLVAAAFPPAAPPEGGAPVPSPEMRAASLAMLDHLVMVFQMPETLKSTAVQAAAKALPEPEPEEPEEKPGVSEEEARALMAKVAAQFPAGQLPPEGV